MISKGMEIASKGMNALIDFNDTIANNIANVNTSGFKRAGLTFKNIYDSAVEKVNLTENPKYAEHKHLGYISMGSKVNTLTNEFSQGALNRTGNPLDIAIEGDGFFKTMSPDGKITYTRNGSFNINNKDMLVDEEGNYVLDVLNKPIKIDLKQGNLRTRGDIIVGEDGQIELNMDNTRLQLQKLAIVDFQNKEDLKSVGHSRYVPSYIGVNPELKSEKFTIQQGAIEASNSNIIREMVNMINVSRNYESLSKFMKTESDNLSRVINLARVNL